LVPRWLPWTVILSSILFFGSDFIFAGKVFLPMDFLQTMRPWDQLFPTKMPINNIVISDVTEFVYPYLHFVSQQLKAGNIPLWNSDIFLGLPTAMMTMTNFVMNPLYLVLFWAFSPATGHGLAILIDLFLIASFSYLLLRERGLSELPALFGSLVLTFNGFLMVWLEFMSVDFSYAGTTISLYLFEKSLAERRTRFPLLNGAVLGILLLGGSVQWVFFLVPLLGLYALSRTMELWDQRRPLWVRIRPLRCYLGPLLVGILIALPTIWHFFEYMQLSQRTTRTFESMRAKMGTFYPELILTFLFPNFFGYQPGGAYFARGSSTVVYQNYNEMGVYMGVTTLVLAAFAYRVKSYRWTAVFWSSIVALAVIVAMKLPLLYFLMYRYVPGFNGMQPSRIFILLPPAFAFLSALGMESLLRRPLEAREASLVWKWLVGMVSSLMLALIGTHYYFLQHPLVIRGYSLANHFRVSNPDFVYPLAFLAAAGAGFILYAKGRIRLPWLCLAFVALIIIDLVPFGLRVNTRVDRSMIFPMTTGFRYLKQDTELFRTLPIGFRYNTFMAYDIETVGGYASMFPASYLELLSAMEAHEQPGAKLGQQHQNYIGPRTLTSTLLPMLNVKYVVAPSGADLPESLRDRYELKHRSDIAIFQARRYLPRAYAVHHYEQTSSRSETIKRMLEEDFDPAHLAIGEKPLPGFDRLSKDVTPPLVSPIKVSRPTTDRFELDVHMVRPGIVVVSEQFFPGWEALVDGTDAELFQVNGVLMGLTVQAGNHHVTLRFMPKPYKLGIIFTALTVGLIAILLGLDAASAKRRTRSPNS
jgi:hypothetical protein